MFDKEKLKQAMDGHGDTNKALAVFLGMTAVVPYYFLVWYNFNTNTKFSLSAVVPYYFLVWYNRTATTPRNHRDYAGFLF